MSLADRLAQARGEAASPLATAAPVPDPLTVPPPLTPLGPFTPLGRAAHRAAPIPVLPVHAPAAASATSSRAPTPRSATVGTPATAPPADALGKLKDRTSKALYEKIGARMTDSGLSEDQLHVLVRAQLSEVIDLNRRVLHFKFETAPLHQGVTNEIAKNIF